MILKIVTKSNSIIFIESGDFQSQIDHPMIYLSTK